MLSSCANTNACYAKLQLFSAQLRPEFGIAKEIGYLYIQNRKYSVQYLSRSEKLSNSGIDTTILTPWYSGIDATILTPWYSGIDTTILTPWYSGIDTTILTPWYSGIDTTILTPWYSGIDTTILTPWYSGIDTTWYSGIDTTILTDCWSIAQFEKMMTLTRCGFNVGPPQDAHPILGNAGPTSKTVGQHYPAIGSMYRVCTNCETVY